MVALPLKGAGSESACLGSPKTRASKHGQHSVRSKKEVQVHQFVSFVLSAVSLPPDLS